MKLNMARDHLCTERQYIWHLARWSPWSAWA